MTRTHRLAAVVLAAVVLLGACGGDEEPAQALGDAAHPPVVVAASTPVRDTAAVISALKRLDPCALLDPIAAGIPGRPGEGTRPAPHNCEIGDLGVTLGTPLSRMSRYGMPRRTVAGNVVYVDRPSTGCAYLLPVGPVHAIRFEADTDRDVIEPCAALDRLVPVALSKLGTPVPPGDRLSTVDACSVLTAALRDPGLGRSAVEESRKGLHSCGEGNIYGNSLKLAYGKDPARVHTDRPSRQVGGRTLVEIGRDPMCTVAWSEGPAATAFATVELHASCDRVDTVAAEVMRLLDAPPPDVPPIQPLPYPPGQTGLPGEGGCADVRPDRPCQPVSPEPYAPHDPVALVNAAAGDSGVLCGLAAEAVRAHLGPELRPVLTDADGCVFVEPSLRREVTVRVEAGELPGMPWQAVTIAGRPGYLRGAGDGELGTDRLVALVEGGGEGTARLLKIGIRIRPERGAGPGPGNVNTAGVEKQDALAADIVARAFP
ncbi:hypothetical protein [Amycolatopsis suaedae]|uniref:Uncharacterized protein n=1 Tax=Amycolatopsis suaedae TaxID=2510978 RepID=A0A4Q7J474_9PSEU|nr:hypothetical protein [Amycolatopsis suaedae]RZQ62351.1 hypothetical protein EWH70_18940 [Amycolatopsis suaedae]